MTVRLSPMLMRAIPLASATTTPIKPASWGWWSRMQDLRLAKALMRMQGPAVRKANVFGNVPMRDWSDNAEPAHRRATDPVPGSNHDEVVRRVSAGAAEEGNLRIALDEREAAVRADAESRMGLKGTLRGLNQFGVDTVRSPYYLYTSLRDNGLGGTAGLMLEGLVSTPSALYDAYNSGDMQTLTAAGLGGAFGLKIPGGRFVKPGNSLPDGLAYRLDLPEHLAGPDGFTKSGQLSGTHNLSNATAALDAKGATYTLTPTGTAGVSELSYSYVKATSGKTITGSKTVYDPAVFSDQTMLDYSLNAGQQGWSRYLANPTTTSFDVTHGGVNFRTYINVDQYGNPYIGKLHPIK